MNFILNQLNEVSGTPDKVGHVVQQVHGNKRIQILTRQHFGSTFIYME